MRTDGCYRGYIKLIKWVLIITLLFPFNIQNVKAQETIEYTDTLAKENVAYANHEFVEASWVRIQAEASYRQPEVKRTNHESYWQRQCVYYIKQITGVWTTYGNGGSKLSANSGPAVGVAIIFYGTHIGWITDFDGTTITYTDKNSDYKGTVRYGVKIASNSPSIWKYHQF